jgi:uracil-DNA glycosylase family 4
MNTFYSYLKNDIVLDIKLVEKDPLSEFNADPPYCTLCSQCNNMVRGYGVLRPKIMVIGESPSQYDFEYGLLFSDNLGKKLHGMISYLNRQCNLINNVYCTCVSLCVNSDQSTFCKKRLVAEIELVNPKLILFLGTEAAKTFFNDPIIGNFAVLSLDKYYETFVTHSLKDILFRNSEVRSEVKDNLDKVAKKLNG